MREKFYYFEENLNWVIINFFKLTLLSILVEFILGDLRISLDILITEVMVPAGIGAILLKKTVFEKDTIKTDYRYVLGYKFGLAIAVTYLFLFRKMLGYIISLIMKLSIDFGKFISMIIAIAPLLWIAIILMWYAVLNDEKEKGFFKGFLRISLYIFILWIFKWMLFYGIRII